MRENRAVPLARRLVLLLAALLFLAESPLHAGHALEMALAPQGTHGGAGGEMGMDMAGMAGGDHPGPVPAPSGSHARDHTCCLPPVAHLAPEMAFAVAAARPLLHTSPSSVHAHRLAVPRRARGPPLPG